MERERKIAADIQDQKEVGKLIVTEFFYNVSQALFHSSSFPKDKMQREESAKSGINASSNSVQEIPNAPDVEQETLDEKQGSLILGIISQLRKGADLHKVTLPTFVLEPRSMLERISDFVSHPDIILNTSKTDDSTLRFLDVVKYFLSIWRIYS